jgi:hypothetical protein
MHDATSDRDLVPDRRSFYSAILEDVHQSPENRCQHHEADNDPSQVILLRLIVVLIW